MEILGFTDSDASINAWAFQLIHTSIDFFFKKTFIGLAVFIIGLFILLIRLTQGEQIRKILVLIIGSLAFIFLILKPSYTPNQIRSFQDTGHILSIERKPMPLVLVAIDFWSNYIIASLIELSSVGKSNQLKYLRNAFKVHLQLLSTQERLLKPIEKISLAERLKDFLEDEYWPALVKTNLHHVRPEDSRMLSLYSIEGSERWGGINHDIDEFISTDPQWQETVSLFALIHSNPTYSYSNQIKDAYFAHELKLTTQSSFSRVSRYIYTYWFSVIGFINAYVWLTLIPILMLVCITMRFSCILGWFKCLMWAKGLWLIGFMVYGSSLVLIQSEKALISTRVVDLGAVFLPLLACSSAWVFMRLK